MAAADRAYRAQIRLDAEGEQMADRIAVALSMATGRPVTRTQAVKAALRYYTSEQLGKPAGPDPRKETP